MSALAVVVYYYTVLYCIARGNRLRKIYCDLSYTVAVVAVDHMIGVTFVNYGYNVLYISWQ